MTEIEKIKYHIRLLSEALDAHKYPTASLVISNNWTQNDLSAAHDIFEKYDTILEKKLPTNWNEFEQDFKGQLGINYQDLKSIVLAFFRNGQWVEVCTKYAADNPCLEFSELFGDQNLKEGTLEDRVASIFRQHKLPYSREVFLEVNKKRFALDFLLEFPRAKVAIEVKREIHSDAFEKLRAIANEIKATKIANEFWIILERTSPDNILDLSEILTTKILSISDLEMLLASQS